MREELVHVTEDAFHRIQSPHPDNPRSDENLANAAQVAIWTCDKGLRGRVHVTVREGRATLHGSADTEAQRLAAEAAVRALGEFDAVANAIDLAGAMEPPPAVPEAVAAQPMIFVTRFCGHDSSSLTAAVNDAIVALDRYFAESALTPPDEAIVVYRNRLPESVVIDIGYGVATAPQTTHTREFSVGRSPGGQMISLLPPAGTPASFAAHDMLLRQARAASLTPGNFVWQRVSRAGGHRRADRLARRLYLPVS